LTEEDVPRTAADDERVFYVVTPAYRSWSNAPWFGKAVPADFVYRSDLNEWNLSVAAIRTLLGDIQCDF